MQVQHAHEPTKPYAVRLTYQSAFKQATWEDSVTETCSAMLERFFSRWVSDLCDFSQMVFGMG
jgi:hypothetical protein